MNKEHAIIRLVDGVVHYDALKLAQIETEGVFLKDYPNHVILVKTQNTLYGFITRDGQVEGKAVSDISFVTPKYLAEHTKDIDIHGSTWGGSMIKAGYIGVGMYLKFSFLAHRGAITTSEIANVRIAPLVEEANDRSATAA